MAGAPNGMQVSESSINGAGARRPGVGQGIGLLSARLGESMEVIRAEYDGLVSELGAVRGARDEWEGKGVYSLFSFFTTN
jgi:hypothetical protein